MYNEEQMEYICTVSIFYLRRNQPKHWKSLLSSKWKHSIYQTEPLKTVTLNSSSVKNENAWPICYYDDVNWIHLMFRCSACMSFPSSLELSNIFIFHIVYELSIYMADSYSFCGTLSSTVPLTNINFMRSTFLFCSNNKYSTLL
jgi:hypothetical protein